MNRKFKNSSVEVTATTTDYFGNHIVTQYVVEKDDVGMLEEVIE